MDVRRGTQNELGLSPNRSTNRTSDIGERWTISDTGSTRCRSIIFVQIRADVEGHAGFTT